MKYLAKVFVLLLCLALIFAATGCGTPKDTVPPTISSVSASAITASGTTTYWTTDEDATSQVEYGTTASYGSSSVLDSSLVAAHAVNLTGLIAGTTYHCRAKSADAAGNEVVSADNSFTTSAPSAIFTITSFDQSYYQSLNEWSEYVYIYFDVVNNGTVYLSFYTVDFTITCDDGSQIQYTTNGANVFVGETWPDWGITSVNSTSKKVVSVQVADWELTGGTPSEVIYEVNGTADKVDVTLHNATGGTEQHSSVSVPIRYPFGRFSDTFLYISAQNQGEYGTVRVSIYVDGEIFKTSSSSGAYVIATASGSKG